MGALGGSQGGSISAVAQNGTGSMTADEIRVKGEEAT